MGEIQKTSNTRFFPEESPPLHGFALFPGLGQWLDAREDERVKED
jgi:hypothetical protein